MRGADLLVHPSLYEGFGLVLLEAMARGCPVARADATALPETAGGAAELFDPDDPQTSPPRSRASSTTREHRAELVDARPRARGRLLAGRRPPTRPSPSTTRCSR